MSGLSISKAARAAGVGIETIRFYERKGLIEQPPSPNGRGFRMYPEATVRLVHFIRQAQKTGFSLSDISELLALRADPATDCINVRARAQAKLDEVNRKIERLHRIQASLIALIAACPGQGAIQECPIIEAFEDNAPVDNVASGRSIA